jgi:hypothetical protein
MSKKKPMELTICVPESGCLDPSFLKWAFNTALNYKEQGNTREWAMGVFDGMHIPREVAADLLDKKREATFKEDVISIPVTASEHQTAVELATR